MADVGSLVAVDSPWSLLQYNYCGHGGVMIYMLLLSWSLLIHKNHLLGCARYAFASLIAADIELLLTGLSELRLLSR